MPSGYDAEVAELFRDLRAATALSEMDLASRIGTRPEVVQALEQGALNALPPWAETCRVVNAYGTLLNLDVRPLLRRIYAQLEAGIVELQPKPMPDLPTMTPRDSGDFAFPAPNTGGAPNPLDIPWPPPSQQQPQRQMPRPNPGPAPAPQARRPNAEPPPQQQNARPQGPVGQPQPHGFPGPKPMPQAFRPTAPGQRPAAPQAPADRRAPQPRPGPARPPQPQPAAQRQTGPSDSERLQAAFGPAAAPPAPEPATKRRGSRLLKWAIIVLIVAVMASGLGLLYVFAPGSTGLQSPETGTTDPDDPRSKKTDRLPDATAPPPPAQ
jgi:hypothetical protein